MDRKKLWFYSKIAMSLTLIVGMFLFVSQKGHVFARLKTMNSSVLFAFLGCHFLNFFLLGVIFQRSVHNRYFSKMSFKEWFGLTMTSNLFNLFLPAKGGTALKLHYLKKNYAFPIREFLYLNGRAVLWGFVVVSLAGLGICHYSSTPIFQELSGVAAIVFCMCIGGFVFLPKLKRSNRPQGFTSKDLIIISLAFLGIFVLYPIKLYLGLDALGLQMDPSELFEVGLIVLFASSFPILPGNIGIKELVTATMSSRYGIPMEYALTAGILDRASLYLFLVPFGLYFSYSLHIKETNQKEMEYYGELLEAAEPVSE